MTVTIPPDQAPAMIGETLFVSPWTEVDREHLAQFAWATYLDAGHTDLTVSRNNPLGPDLVDGFLLLSLLTSMHFNNSRIDPAGLWGLNYGLDRVRFTSPVFAGERIRCVAVLTAAEDRGDGRMLIKTTNTIEVEGRDKPAMVAEWVCLYVAGAAT